MQLHPAAHRQPFRPQAGWAGRFSDDMQDMPEGASGRHEERAGVAIERQSSGWRGRDIRIARLPGSHAFAFAVGGQASQHGRSARSRGVPRDHGEVRRGVRLRRSLDGAVSCGRSRIGGPSVAIAAHRDDGGQCRQKRIRHGAARHALGRGLGSTSRAASNRHLATKDQARRVAIPGGIA